VDIPFDPPAVFVGAEVAVVSTYLRQVSAAWRARVGGEYDLPGPRMVVQR
jgi:hypothetical protein